MLTKIPTDVLLLIFEHLDLRSLILLSGTCKGLYALLNSTTPIIASVAAQEFPLQDPATIQSTLPINVAIKQRIAKCSRFHNAWRGAQVNTKVIRQLPIAEGICMIRILPGGRFLVVIDFLEGAKFFHLETGRLVGSKSFHLISSPEMIYSIDFAGISRTTVAWGMLTSENDAGNEGKLCARVTLIHLPEPGEEDQTLKFEQVLEHEFHGTAEMLSISGDIVVIYTYPVDAGIDLRLSVWNWRTKEHVWYPVPWRNEHDAQEYLLGEYQGEAYPGHPSLHATPDVVFLIGGQLGWHRLHADNQIEGTWGYRRAIHVPSTQEDKDELRYSSQGRCSKQWWGYKGQSKPLKVLTFEVPNGPDSPTRKVLLDLGQHNVLNGWESSPPLFHSSRFGSKAIWLANQENQGPVINSISFPPFHRQLAGAPASDIRKIALDPAIDIIGIRAFDMDETVPLIAFAEFDKVWIVEVVPSE
ncbi:hypothetical protein FRC17_010950 [Serendipita sp. 399]|nr:hypothetical protein FRC17_010950 [Serendipita sp. 399]